MLETAAEWLSGLDHADVPVRVRSLAHHQVGNILAATLAGSRSAAGRKARSAFLQTAGTGPCTVIPHGGRSGLFDVLHLHSIYANALELDDFLYRGHLGQAVVLAPLALGEMLECSGTEIITALVAGNEVAGRLGASITADVLHGHQRTYLQRLAAACCAAKLLRLDATRCSHALAIAMTQPEYALHPGEFSPETKVLSAAASVTEGVRAAFLAADGLTAALDILEHPAGFFRQFTLHRHRPNPFVQLGEAWVTDALAFKRYSACGYAAGAVHAMVLIQAREYTAPEDIGAIDIATTGPALMLEQLATPHFRDVYTPVNVQFSIRRSTALAALHGDLRGWHYTEDAFAEALPALRALSSRTHVTHDWHLTVELLRGLDDGLVDGGAAHSAGTLDFLRASRAFRKRFGNAHSVTLRDLPRILSMRREARGYFMRRFLRGVDGSRQNEGKVFGDLGRLSWRMAAVVRLTRTDGSSVEERVIVPPGMAGDPGRCEMVEQKIITEAGPVIGTQRAAALLGAVLHIEEQGISPIFTALTLSEETTHGT